MAKKIPRIIKEIRKYKPEEINYAFQKGISYSQLSMFNNCAHQWALRYRDGHKVFSSTIHTVFGTALHTALQHYLTVMYEKSGAAANRENMVEIFENALREEYKTQYKINNNQHFSSAEELREFFEDGVEIIRYFAKKRGQYFSNRGWYLVGCEIPIVLTPNKMYKHVVYQGYLDVVMYHEPTNTFKIIDIKTSTRGWDQKTKKDETKQSQLILYKKFFSEQFGIPQESIDIEFLIVKRKIYENSDYPISRIQTFKPASGKVKIGKATKSLNEFIETVFNKTGYKEQEYKPNASKWNCQFCPFSQNPTLCSEGHKFS